jgi:hypothetical protein
VAKEFDTSCWGKNKSINFIKGPSNSEQKLPSRLSNTVKSDHHSSATNPSAGTVAGVTTSKSDHESTKGDPGTGVSADGGPTLKSDQQSTEGDPGPGVSADGPTPGTNFLLGKAGPCAGARGCDPLKTDHQSTVVDPLTGNGGITPKTDHPSTMVDPGTGAGGATPKTDQPSTEVGPVSGAGGTTSRIIELLPDGITLRFTNYPSAPPFDLAVGTEQSLENSTVILLNTGRLLYSFQDGTTKLAKIPLGASQHQFWCKLCAGGLSCCGRDHTEEE